MIPRTFGAAVLACLVSSASLAAADGPDHFRVRDVNPGDTLAIREQPSASARRVGRIPHDAGRIENLGCVQVHNGRIQPQSDKPVGVLWCWVSYRGTQGWVAGRFLTEDGGASAPAGEPPAIVAEAIRETREDCKTFVQQGGFVRSDRDINGDGVMDWILDYEHVECNGSVSYFCGTAGCVIEIYLSRSPSEFVRAYAGNVRGYTIRPGPPPSLRLGLHGSACGRVGAADCAVVYRIEGTRLVRTGRPGR